ncbi:non-ribosomal peptide synthetase [Actinokineospora sp. 24-640]
MTVQGTQQGRVEQAAATAGQEQVWFFDHLVHGATVHTVPVYVDITGPLDTAALATALTSVVARHEPLRTSYTSGPGGLVARIAADAAVAIEEVVDTAAVHAELARPIDIASGLPLRALLLRHNENSHRLVLLIHHIAVDGASVAIIQDELLTCYQAAVEGREPALPALSGRYRDAVPARDHAAAVERWRGVLADLPDPIELPNARSRPAVADFGAEALPLVVPAPLAEKVRTLARARRSSPFMVLLTAFSVLLHRVTGARDLVVGTPSAGRDDAEDLVGYFVNMLALRLRLDGDPTPAEAMDRARDAVITALELRDAPFHQVVRAVGAEREVDRHPVFQVVFACPPPLAGPRAAGGCEFAFTQGTSLEGLYDLEVQLPDSGAGELRGWVKFRTARHGRADIAELADRFLLVLDQLTGSGERMSNLSPLRADEREHIVTALNDNATAYPADATLVELFADAVARHAGDVAVEYGDRRLTYAELDRAAESLAQRLIHAGAAVGAPVGIHLERGLDWVVAALAALKAGAAYLPLDPDYPADRLATLCADSGTAVVIADGRARTSLPGTTVVDIAVAETVPSMSPQRTSTPDDLAYVMYTSGSTGTPKGVCVTHRNVARLVLETSYVTFAPGDRVAQASTTTFDAATFELWGALLTGGRLVGMPKDVAIDPTRLGPWLRANEIDTLFLTTSLAMHVARTAPEALAGLRHFVFGGEQPDTAAVAALAARADRPAHVVNGYGPTETTTFASWHECSEVRADDGRVPIGRPLNNTQLYVLDEYLEPVPVGVVGELCVGGDGVARGYAGRPGLTAEKFVPDHLGGRSGARLYRTGDLARLRPDGAVEYLGRVDRQVKIRGFRVEPGEVEAALLAAGPVTAAVVTPRVDGGGDPVLVGYVTPADVDTAALMARLRAELPAFLVPAALVALDAFPVTRNGKLDPRALPEPGPTAATAGTADAEPRTPTERRVAEVWAAVLGTGPVGRDANFFDLGGHSLKATRLVSRIAGELRVEVPLRLLFDHPTVAGLAAKVDAEVERLGAAPATPAPATPAPATPAPATPAPATPALTAGDRAALSVADLIAGLDEPADA